MSPSWEIYERWCFLRVGQLLQGQFPTWNWQQLKNPPRRMGVSGGRRAELLLQPMFRSFTLGCDPSPRNEYPI